MTIDPYESERLAPHSVEAEEAVLGSVLLNPDVHPELSSYLDVDSFFILRHAWIWEAIERLVERGDAIDNLTVINELRNQQRLDEIGGSAYITYLINSTPTSLHYEVYGRIVERAAVRRRLLTAASEIAGFATNPDLDTNEAVTRSQEALDAASLKLESEEQGLTQAGETAWEYHEMMLSGIKRKYIATGLGAMDYLLGGGFENNALHVVAGLPGTGKSAFAKQLALYAAGFRGRRATAHGGNTDNMHFFKDFAPLHDRHRVAYYLLEGEKSIVTHRLLAEMLNVNSWYIKNEVVPNDPDCRKCAGADKATKKLCDCRAAYAPVWEQRLLTAITQLNAHLPIFIDDRPCTVATWKSRVRRAFKTSYYDLVIVDHPGRFLAKHARQTEYELEAEAFNAGIELALELNTCVVMLSQVNKGGGGLARPININDIKGNSVIAHNAFTIWAIHLEDIVSIDATGMEVTKKGSRGSFICLKNREGDNDENSIVPVHLRRETTHFEVASRETPTR